MYCEGWFLRCRRVVIIMCISTPSLLRLLEDGFCCSFKEKYLVGSYVPRGRCHISGAFVVQTYTQQFIKHLSSCWNNTFTNNTAVKKIRWRLLQAAMKQIRLAAPRILRKLCLGEYTAWVYLRFVHTWSGVVGVLWVV